MSTVPAPAPSPLPTPENIAIVQKSLQNMLAFNKVMRTFVALYLPNAYTKLSQVDDQTTQSVVGINILDGLFWAAGSEFGPVGNFAASFISGMISNWTTSPPPDLAGSYSDLLTTLTQTSLAVDTQLNIFYNAAAKHWADTYTYNGKTYTLGGTTNQPFPSDTDAAYPAMEVAAALSTDQGIWTYLLKAQFHITQWQSPNGISIPGEQNTAPTAWITQFYQRNPAYFANYAWFSTSGCGAKSGYHITEYNLGITPDQHNDNAITTAAAQYLFTDFDPAKPSTTSGLFTREFVFVSMGLDVKGWFLPNDPNGLQFSTDADGKPFAQTGEPALTSVAVETPPPALSIPYLRAMKEGKTLTHLIASEGRASVEARVLAQAKSDPIFSADLKLRPRQTLQEFLGVLIADPIKLSVIVEDSLTFGIVIPQQPS